jgi:ATP-dependent Clp protease ATP-binding subunit ClpA
MFERFTDGARGVVVDAREQARSLQHDEVLAEHLLLAVLTGTDTAGARVLREHGLRADRLIEEVAALGTGDRDALREIGIDLAEVRQRAEAAFGPGALDRPRPRRTGLLRRRVVWTGGHLRFSDAAKRALEQSLRQALALRHRSIGVDHVLLGLLADDQDPAARTLRRLGVVPADVRAQVREQLQRAA